MKPEPAPAGWWELHLRHARGEQLSEAERQLYEKEVARQDRAAMPSGDDGSLRRLHDSLVILIDETVRLRTRLERIQTDAYFIDEARNC